LCDVFTVAWFAFPVSDFTLISLLGFMRKDLDLTAKANFVIESHGTLDFTCCNTFSMEI
jgi:hypothetical protein